MDVRAAYDALGLPPGTPPAAIRAAYRSGLRRSHPDTAVRPDPSALARVRDAYRTLVAAGATRVDAATAHAAAEPQRHVDVYA